MSEQSEVAMSSIDWNRVREQANRNRYRQPAGLGFEDPLSYPCTGGLKGITRRVELGVEARRRAFLELDRYVKAAMTDRSRRRLSQQLELLGALKKVLGHCENLPPPYSLLELGSLQHARAALATHRH
jgi:hypothetical protein